METAQAIFRSHLCIIETLHRILERSIVVGIPSRR